MERRAKNRRNELAISSVARNVRSYRKARKMTILQLSDLLNADYSQVSRIERGIVDPSISIIFDIAEILGVRPGQLLGEK